MPGTTGMRRHTVDLGDRAATIGRLGAAFALLAFAFRGHAGAADVRVTNEAGLPVPEALVACVRGGSDAGLTDGAGVVQLPDTCRAVYCERGGLVPDGAAIRDGRAACLLRTGVSLTVEMPAAVCGPGRFFPEEGERSCYAVIRDAQPTNTRADLIVRGPRRSDTGPLVQREGDPRTLERRFHPLMPGSYRLSISRSPDRWTCSTALDALPAGERIIAPVWRDPAVVRGRVVGRDGKAAADVPLFVRVAEPGEVRGAGGWVCAAEEAGVPPASELDGSFVLNVDPGLAVRIEAGWKDYPIGTAAATVRAPVTAEFVLRLQ